MSLATATPTGTTNVSELYFDRHAREHDNYFRLDPNFLKDYEGKKPNFGFHGLGEMVFYRTYSRLMEDGRKETFLDMLQRVVEGTYEIQRRHNHRIHIPWTYSKAQRSAQEMFRRMWDFKFLPPGRGLWTMGTPFMWERGSASLNNCFRGDTEIVTRDGIRLIGPLAGTTQTVMTKSGKWAEAPIYSFGIQRIWKLTLERPGEEKVIYTTEDHRWFAAIPIPAMTSENLVAMLNGERGVDDTPLGPECRVWRYTTTARLHPGDALKSVYGPDDSENIDWRVQTVQQTDEMAEVYCAQVPGTHSFALADNILTGNCGLVSTVDIGDDPAEPFAFLQDMSMLGVGVGFDTRGAGKLRINRTGHGLRQYQISDSREGWVDSTRQLINSYTVDAGNGHIEYDYSLVRPAGVPIKGFGGKASGPGILMTLHDMIRGLLERRVGRYLSSVDIVDLMNYIGRCVVAGNVRRTAEIVFGEPDDADYVNMKNPTWRLAPEDLPLWYAITTALFKAEIMVAKPEYFSSPRLILDERLVPELREAVRTVLNTMMGDMGVSDWQPQLIPRERLLPAIATWNEMNSHRWASNNSIFAKVGMDYRPVAETAAVNGEPGLLWLDTARNYGRMIDGRQEGIDALVAGANPCFAGTARLLTGHGYRTMYDAWVAGGCQEYNRETHRSLHREAQLAACGHGTEPTNRWWTPGSADILDHYGTQQVVNRNGVVSATNVYRTAVNADLFRVTFSDGSWIDATDQHAFIILVRQPRNHGKTRSMLEVRKPLSVLKAGDLVPTSQTEAFGTGHDPEFAEAAGWCIGDGSLSPKADGQVWAQLNCYEADIEHVLPTLQQDLFRIYEKYNTSSNQHPGYIGWERVQEHFEHREEIIGSNVLGRLLRSNGVVPGDKHRVPKVLWECDRPTVAAFLRGLASADGSPQPNEAKKSISIRIGQSGGAGRRLLLECRLLLSQFGIHSSVRKTKAPTTQLMNDGKGGKKLYHKQQPWVLIISGRKQVVRFLDHIGFIQPWKHEIARLWLDYHPGSNNSDTGRYTKVVSVEYVGRGETFCLTEPGENRVVVEGHEVGQCNEQSLESYELCCLCETFPAHHDDAKDYLRTLKFAYLYAKTVTLLPTHNARTNQVMLRNRRIGLSQSGIIQAFEKFGRRRVLQDFCDDGYREIRRWDDIYSKWMCVPKSIKVTSVKPSGTVSLVAGATPGIHYPEARTYWRRVRVSKESILARIYAAAGYEVEPDHKEPDRTMVIKFGVSDERVRPQDEVTIWEQTANAADYQTYWADNQVSITIKFQPHERGQIRPVLEAFEDRLKGVSFLPHLGHGFDQPPYEPCTRAEVDAYNTRLQPVDFSLFINEDAIGTKFCDGDGACSTGL